jgi:hypothetical protein
MVFENLTEYPRAVGQLKTLGMVRAAVLLMLVAAPPTAGPRFAVAPEPSLDSSPISSA